MGTTTPKRYRLPGNLARRARPSAPSGAGCGTTPRRGSPNAKPNRCSRLRDAGRAGGVQRAGGHAAGTELDAEGAGSAIADELAAHRGGQASSTVRWNRESTAIFRRRLTPGGPPPAWGRVNTYLGLAQYRAVLAARSGWHHGRRASLAGAAAGASVVVLKQFYPLDRAVIDAEFAAQRAEYAERSHKQAAFDAGDAIGREVAAAVLVEAASDNVGVARLPPQPAGPGYWVSSGAATKKGNYGARPFFLKSNDEINAPPPPAFGSAAFLAGLAEVRALSDARTRAGSDHSQVGAILGVRVQRQGGGPDRPALPRRGRGGADLRLRQRGGVRRHHRLLPYQVHLVVHPPHAGRSRHHTRHGPAQPPVIPSAHSCQSGAWEAVLADAFPSERRSLRAMAEEASYSRVVGGLHYTFDGDAGLALGRKAGRLALKRGIL